MKGLTIEQIRKEPQGNLKIAKLATIFQQNLLD